uniref:IRS-type PTB domain-containing protein n=1 Tax=Elaeophora elaphi TaxID=1147741 RepID=A0A0R3S2N6_9BILA
MSSMLTGRARVVYVGDEFIHLSKGGLDGKIVAFKDSWLTNSYDLQDWVTFKAKSYEAEPPHCNFGVRFKALAKSVKFESKAVMSEGVGTFFKVDEHQGQYGFITTNDGNTVYFTASVVRPETQDIRNAFKTGIQIRYKAIEQKQNNCRWRAIAVCNKNVTFESFSSRQQKPVESSNNKPVAATVIKKTAQSSVPTLNATTKHVGNNDAHSNGVQATTWATTNLSLNNSIQSTKQVNPTVDSRSSSLSRSETSAAVGSSRLSSASLLTTNALPSTTFAESTGTGDAYEDAVRLMAYFRHLVTECSCQSCVLR